MPTVIPVNAPRYVAWKQARLVGHNGIPRQVMKACLEVDALKGLSLYDLTMICRPHNTTLVQAVIDALVRGGLLHQINGKVTRHGIR